MPQYFLARCEGELYMHLAGERVQSGSAFDRPLDTLTIPSNHDSPIPQPPCHSGRIRNEVDKQNIVYNVSRRINAAQESSCFGTPGTDRQVAFEFPPTFGSREASRGRPTLYEDSKGIVLGIQQAPSLNLLELGTSHG